MGFPGEVADWATMEGAIFMGFGTSAPGFYSFLAIAAAIGALVIGYINEKGKYK